MNRILLQSINRYLITDNERTLYKYIYKNMKNVHFVGGIKPEFIKEEHFINETKIHKVSTKDDILVLANYLLKKTNSKNVLFIHHGFSSKTSFLKSAKSYPIHLRPFVKFAMKYNIKKFTKIASYCDSMTNQIIDSAKVSKEKILKCGYFRDFKKVETKYKEAYFPTWREGDVKISIPKRNILVSKHPKTKQVFKRELKLRVTEVGTAWLDYSSLIYDCYVNKINYKLWRPDLTRYKKRRGFEDVMDNTHKNLKPYHLHEKANKIIVKTLKGWLK